MATRTNEEITELQSLANAFSDSPQLCVLLLLAKDAAEHPRTLLGDEGDSPIQLKTVAKIMSVRRERITNIISSANRPEASTLWDLGAVTNLGRTQRPENRWVATHQGIQIMKNAARRYREISWIISQGLLIDKASLIQKQQYPNDQLFPDNTPKAHLLGYEFRKTIEDSLATQESTTAFVSLCLEKAALVESVILDLETVTSGQGIEIPEGRPKIRYSTGFETSRTSTISGSSQRLFFPDFDTVAIDKDPITPADMLEKSDLALMPVWLVVLIGHTLATVRQPDVRISQTKLAELTFVSQPAINQMMRKGRTRSDGDSISLYLDGMPPRPTLLAAEFYDKARDLYFQAAATLRQGLESQDLDRDESLVSTKFWNHKNGKPTANFINKAFAAAESTEELEDLAIRFTEIAKALDHFAKVTRGIAQPLLLEPKFVAPKHPASLQR